MKEEKKKKNLNFFFSLPKSCCMEHGWPMCDFFSKVSKLLKIRLESCILNKNAEKPVFTCKDRCWYSRKRATFCKNISKKWQLPYRRSHMALRVSACRCPAAPSTLFQKANERLSICLLALYRSIICVHSFQYSSFCHFFTVARRCLVSLHLRQNTDL